MQYKGKNHHTYGINSLTFHKKKFWIVCFLFAIWLKYTSYGMRLQIPQLFFNLYNWMNQMFIFIVVIHTSPFPIELLGPLQNKDSFSKHGNFHCKHKTVVRQSYLNNGNSYTGKTASLYWNVHLSKYGKFYLNDTFSRYFAVLFIFCILLLNWYRKL